MAVLPQIKKLGGGTLSHFTSDYFKNPTFLYKLFFVVCDANLAYKVEKESLFVLCDIIPNICIKYRVEEWTI